MAATTAPTRIVTMREIIPERGKPNICLEKSSTVRQDELVIGRRIVLTKQTNCPVLEWSHCVSPLLRITAPYTQHKREQEETLEH